ILPVIEMGGRGIHVPFHTTWVHEEVADFDCSSDKCIKVDSVIELLDLL
ncbi:MAG: hypothetical protein JEZ09_19070, partial [Salinivirgaceae bacterium]|nr:hypothetical protein [Salinivirgaceae bacterium]